MPLWRRALRAVWLLAVLVALVLVLRERGAELSEALGALSAPVLAASGLAMAAAVCASLQVWRTQMAALGSPLRLPDSARVFFVGQLGKYLPGSLWPVLAQMEMGRDLAVPARVSAAAFALFMLEYVLTGALVAALALPAAGLLPWWAAVAALPSLALLFPRQLGTLLDRLLRLVRRRPLPALPSRSAMLRAAGWMLLVWLLAGLHVWLLAAQLGLALGPVGSAGLFAGAWVGGFLLLVAPAGVGAREAVIVAVLAPIAGAAPALALALVSRVLGTLADAAWAALSLLARPRPAP